MKFNLKKYTEEGYLIKKKIISKKDINFFFEEIEKLNKLNKKKNFESLFKYSNQRDLIYKKLQNLNSVRHIVQKICDTIRNNNIYEKLNFQVPFITNGLIISLPNEKDNLNPIHQDIYNFFSYNFIKIWLPLTSVNEKNGSMLLYKSSNKLGFIEPKYKNKKSTYPEIDKKFVKGFEKIIFDLDPGDCVIFNPLILHKSVKNKSKFTRFTIGIDIQDFNINGDSKIIKQMISIKNQRSHKRNVMKNK